MATTTTRVKPTAQPLDEELVGNKLAQRRNRILEILVTGFATVVVLLAIYPFLCVIGSTFNKIDAVQNPLTPIPTEFSLQYYELMLTKYHFNKYILNSVFVAFSTTALGTFASTLSGYALAKLRFAGRRVLFMMIVSVMLMPMPMMLISKFLVMRSLNLVDNYWGLILPSIGGGAFGIFLMRQFMLKVPTEMLDAARVDGANEFQVFYNVALPNTLAGVGVLATLSLRGSWNALLWPDILITSQRRRLLMPAIMHLRGAEINDAFARPVMISAALLAAVVPLGLYAYSQRYFLETFAGALKG